MIHDVWVLYAMFNDFWPGNVARRTFIPDVPAVHAYR